MAFHLYTSSSLENLAELYSQERLKACRDSERLALFRAKGIFAQESVCVPTNGMRIWLEHYLVSHGHVVANRNYPYITNVVWDILGAQFPAFKQAQDYFSRDALLWRILDILLDDSRVKCHGPLAAYLNTAENPRTKLSRKYELADKLASLYSDYLAFLPDVLTGKTSLPDDGKEWQLSLWQELCRNGEAMLYSPAQAIMDYLALDSTAILPQNPITLFGISAMSPWFLRILKKSASHGNVVHFFYHNVSDEYWGDQRRKNWESGLRADLEDLDEIYNNSLLGNFGEMGRRFFNAVMELNDDFIEHDDRVWHHQREEENDQPGARRPLLPEVQWLVRHCQNPPPNPPELDGGDDSLTVHSCHNDMRQVEVLHDCLLQLLARHPDLKLTDIMVVSPDIARFAPLVNAVFEQGPLKGAFTISDRTILHANLLAESFLNILSLAEGRFEVTKILKLFDSAPLRSRFNLSDQAVVKLSAWIGRANVKWGWDAADRSSYTTRSDHFTWRRGVDRMLLAMAMDATPDNCWKSLRPLDIRLSEENACALGALTQLLEWLRDTAQKLREERTFAEWVEFLLAQLELYFKPDAESAQDYVLLSKTIRELSEATGKSPLAQRKQDFTLPLIWLKHAVTAAMPKDGFLNGKITFCSMMPMRGVPCRVLAMLGMAEGEFPRQDSSLGFNLMTPELSLLKYYDRSKAVEDRFVFLESILAAKEHLLIFFNGQDDCSQQESKPAVPVSELLAYAERVRVGAGDSLLLKHTLNPFDTGNFRLSCEEGAMNLRQGFSYSGLLAELASLQPAGTGESVPLWQAFQNGARGLPVPDKLLQPPEKVTLAELERFLKNPQAHYFSHRFGTVYTDWEEDPPSDYEPFQINYRVEGRFARQVADVVNEKVQSSLGQLQAEEQDDDRLPMGKLRMEKLDEKINEVKLAGDILQAWQTRAEQKVNLTLELGDVFRQLNEEFPDLMRLDKDTLSKCSGWKICLEGKVIAAEQASGYTCIDACFSSEKGRHLIHAYLCHLLLTANGRTGKAAVVRFKKKNSNGQPLNWSIATIANAEEAKEQLKTLLAWYFIGKWRPLPLLENFSPMYA
ncbi:MAG: exodeoxyribonuclease V subunit gamma, partial [Victivallales bacterium]|nr:exodeoxyribonuclease V subunit gamma [Victivallales bacterium]